MPRQGCRGDVSQGEAGNRRTGARRGQDIAPERCARTCPDHVAPAKRRSMTQGWRCPVYQGALPAIEWREELPANRPTPLQQRPGCDSTRHGDLESPVRRAWLYPRTLGPAAARQQLTANSCAHAAAWIAHDVSHHLDVCILPPLRLHLAAAEIRLGILAIPTSISSDRHPPDILSLATQPPLAIASGWQTLARWIVIDG